MARLRLGLPQPHTNWWIVQTNEREVARVAPLAHGEMLDIGCGEKPYEHLFRPYVTRYVGLEHPETQHANHAVDVWGSATDLPFPDGSFDTVAAFQVLEHVEDPSATVREAFRVLRPDGVFIITTPFMWGLHEEPRDFYRYTKYGLRFLLTTAGFDEVEVSAVSGVWAMLGLRFSYALEPYARSLWRLPVIMLQFLAQAAGAQLDRIARDERDTAGYVTIARVPS